MSQDLNITRRHLPHWTLEGSTYFITFRLLTGTLTNPEIRLVLNHLKSGDKTFYWLQAATVMPDHVHLLLRPNTGYELSRIMKGIKGVSSRLLNESRGTKGNLWQVESFDRIIRNEKEFFEKLNYMMNNAIKTGLVDDPSKFEGWYMDLTPQ